MALITTSGIVANIRGSIGGTTYQRSAAGIIARTRTGGVQPRSPAQTSRRNLMARLQVSWADLTDNQRTAWGEWANYQALTALRTAAAPLTGQQAFLQSSYYMALEGQSQLLDPVFVPYGITQLGAFLTELDGSFLFQLNFVDNGLDNVPIVMMSAPLRVTRMSRPSYLRWIYLTPTPDVSLWEASEQYTNTFGVVPAIGQYIWVEWFILQINNGALGPLTSQRYTIVAE